MTQLVESLLRIEPCLLETIPIAITDRIATLTAEAERLGHRLHPQTTKKLAALVRVMNCFIVPTLRRGNAAV